MPVSFESLEFGRLLHHKLAYECIDAVGGSLYDDWDVIQFEKSVLGAEYCPAFKREDELAILRQELLRLDGQMPFLRFGEEGTHHAYELFLSEPGFWGSRGAPLFWAYAAREFTTDILPLDPRETMINGPIPPQGLSGDGFPMGWAGPGPGIRAPSPSGPPPAGNPGMAVPRDQAAVGRGSSALPADMHIARFDSANAAWSRQPFFSMPR
jgi:hypothetical protein